MADQSMSAHAAQQRIDREAAKFAAMLRGDHWSLEHAHHVLKNDNLSLFEIAGLAKVIACFQCVAVGRNRSES
ncbi:hypothetical protein [Paraburkholderia sacchari]|uniref:hypothetical protein n=1 Tax=Paraburkholderia sacchari TaxID=159450 RepID=UPI001BD0597C|nr:hypothetical protein [Paraburkholderia sacchari]